MNDRHSPFRLIWGSRGKNVEEGAADINGCDALQRKFSQYDGNRTHSTERKRIDTLKSLDDRVDVRPGKYRLAAYERHHADAVNVRKRTWLCSEEIESDTYRIGHRRMAGAESDCDHQDTNQPSDEI